MASEEMRLAQKANKRLGLVEVELGRLAEAFYCTGTDHMGNTLAELANVVAGAAKDYDTAIGLMIRQRLNQSQEMSRAVVEAALAGVHLTKKRDEQ